MNDTASEQPENQSLFNEMAQQVITAAYNKGFAAGHTTGYSEGLNVARSALNGVIPPAPVESNPLKEVSVDMEIEDLNFTTRTYNLLRRLRVFTLGDLLNKTELHLRETYMFGSASVQEVKTKLAELSLALKE